MMSCYDSSLGVISVALNKVTKTVFTNDIITVMVPSTMNRAVLD